MKRTLLSLAAVAALAGVPAVASAAPWQSINQREANLNQRIEQGIRNGALTRPEAMRLRGDLRQLERLEARYRHSRPGLTNSERRDLVSSKVSGLMPTKEDLKRSIAPILRGTFLGGLLGILPGGGAVLASFSAYTVEKKLSRTPEKFGTGMIEGVAGPESANNAAAQTSFIPTLTLGIPSNAVMAMMIGGMMIHGIVPGPQVMEQKPGLFWGMIVSMWFGNLMLVVLNLPLIGIWVRMLLVPYRLLAVAILFFCCIGVYSLNNSANEVLIIAFFGVVGYLFMKLDCEPAPLLMGFLLGPMMEVYMRRAMLLSRGDPLVFVQRPLSLSFLLIACLLLLFIVLPNVRKAREVAFSE